MFPDSVGKDLTTEVQLIVQSQQAACAYLSRICNQIDLNRVTQHRLEKNSAKSEIMAALDSRELQASTGSRSVPSKSVHRLSSFNAKFVILNYLL